MRDSLYILAILTGALLYLAPTIVAHWRRHYYRWPITAINVLLGATGIAWIACLIWALWPEDPTKSRATVEERPVKLTKY